MKRTTTIRFFAILLLAALSVSMTACTPHGERERLQRAEEVIETDAAAAAATLDSIRPSSLHGDARARYALLRTQSDYKNFVPLTSDSLIRIATRRYGTRRPSAAAALAQYYLGCTYKDMGRDLDAIDALLRATTLFPDTTNKYYAYSQMELGRLYVTHKMPDEAIEVLDSFHQMSSERADSGSMAYADYYMGKAYLYAHKETFADSLFLSVATNAHAEQFQQADSYFQLAKNALFIRHDALLAEYYINRYFALYCPAVENGAAWALKGSICQSKEEYDLSYHFFQKAISCKLELNTRSWAYRCLGEMASMTGHADSTSYYVMRHDELLDSAYNQSLQAEIKEILNAHVIELHDREMAARHQHFMLGSILGLLLLLALIAFAFSARDRKRQQAVLQLEAELRESNARQMEASLPDESSPHSVMERGQLMAIYRQKMETSTSLFRTKRGHNLLDEATFKDRELEMSECQAIEDDFYTCFTDIIRDLTLECPKINKQEVYLCLCSSLGYPTKVIASLLSRSEATIRSQKTRLKAKLPADIYHLFFFD